MIDKRLRIKIDSLAKQIMQMSGDLSELQDELTALFDEVYDNGSDDGYEEAEKERKTTEETIASLPAIRDGMKYKVDVEILGGDYCRDAGGNVCDFFWESEDGDTGCCLLGKSTFIEGDISNVPKYDNCPSRFPHSP